MQLKTSIVGTAFLLVIALPTLSQDSTTPAPSGKTPLTGTISEMVQQIKMRDTQPVIPIAANTTALAPMRALSAQDQLFIVRAAEGSLAEIILAQMAVEKSKTPDVKSVAQTIITGHTQAQKDLAALAMRKGMVLKLLTMTMSPAHIAVSMRLREAKGVQFDKMYMSNQTDDSENTIALFQSEIAVGQDEDLKAYAQKYLPDILGRTIMIYIVAQQVRAPGSQVRPTMPPIPPGVTPTVMPMDGITPMDEIPIGNGADMARRIERLSEYRKPKARSFQSGLWV